MLRISLYMPHDRQTMLAFIAYLLVVMLVGVVAFMVTRNLSDYVLGGRRLGGAVAALSAGASDMSAWLLMALPGLVYSAGLGQLGLSIGLVIGAYASWRIVAARLRIYSVLANDSLTVPAYLDNRFQDHSKLIRGIAALALVVFFVFYVASGFYAAAVLLRLSFGLKYAEALWLGAAIIMLYTCVGGFLAVSWTDFFQGNLMLCCLLIVPFMAIEQVGGWQAGVEQLLLCKPDYFKQGTQPAILQLLSQLSWGLGYFGMPHILVRFMAVQDVDQIPLARRICVAWMGLSLVGAFLVGIAGAIFFSAMPLSDPETVFMALSRQTLSPWMVGIILAAILSSSMCAIDSQILAASSALTEDSYRALFRRKASQKELMWVGRLAVLLIAAVALYLARTPAEGIMGLVSFAWAGLGATFAAPVVLSLYWQRTTRNGIIAGMLGGCLTVFLWRGLGFSEQLYELLPASLVSVLGIVVVSLLDKPPSQAIIDLHHRYVENLNAGF